MWSEATVQFDAVGTDVGIGLWYTFTGSSSSCTVSSNDSTLSDDNIAVFELSGIDNTNTLEDFSAMATPASATTTPTAGSITTSNTCTHFFCYAQESAASTQSAGSNYTLAEQNTGHVDAQQIRHGVSAGTYSDEFINTSLSSDVHRTIVVALKEIGGTTNHTWDGNDTFNTADVLLKSSIFNRDLADTPTMGDTIVSSVGFSRTLSESISISDALVALKAAKVTLSESLSLDDSLSKTKTIILALSDIASIVDVLTQRGNIDLSISDSLNLSDNISKTSTFEREILEVLSTLDNLISGNKFKESLSDSEITSDNLTSTRQFNREMTENLQLTDSLISTLSKILTETLADSITFSDSLVDGSAILARVISKLITLRINNNFKLRENKRIKLTWR